MCGELQPLQTARQDEQDGQDETTTRAGAELDSKAKDGTTKSGKRKGNPNTSTRTKAKNRKQKNKSKEPSSYAVVDSSP
jgi:hypothetical protein